MWTPVIYVRTIVLPLSVHGVAMPNPDGSFDVYLNSLLPDDRRLERLRHELQHIKEDHFYRDVAPVSQLEAEADCIALVKE